MPELVFNEESHVYKLDGRWVPGTTRILAESGYYKGSSFFTEESRVRGRQVHLACQWADEYAPKAQTLGAVLDVIEVAEAIHPYLAGYLLFKREKEYRALMSETPVWLSNPRVAGKIDSYGEYQERRAVIDLKSWSNQGPHAQRSAQIQTGGYKLMVEERFKVPVDLRVVVNLPGDGKYRAYELTEHTQDEFIFRCAAYTYWDRWNAKLVDRGSVGEVEVEN